MPGLYNCVEDDVVAVFNATFNHPSVPVFWRMNDLEVAPDPSTTPLFMRNTVLFGPESMMAFGGGRGSNEKCLDGFAELVGFASRSKVSERVLLDLMADATAAFRSKRVIGSYPGGSDLSFTGDGSTFHLQPEETGNWYLRGCRVFWEYRFVG